MSVSYDRDALIDVLTHHWPTPSSGCTCGWSRLGHSFPAHVVSTYEHTMFERSFEEGARLIASVGPSVSEARNPPWHDVEPDPAIVTALRDAGLSVDGGNV